MSEAGTAKLSGRLTLAASVMGHLSTGAMGLRGAGRGHQAGGSESIPTLSTSQ